jgi:hypothetical protein
MAVGMPMIATADHKPGHGNPGPNVGDPTISATPNPVVWGRSVRIAGRLKGGDNAGKTIELQHDPHPFGTTYEKVATTVTSADGVYAFSVLPDRNTNYRAVAKLDPEQFSPNLQVGVRMRVTRQVSDTTPNAGQVVTFTGRVRPAHDGRTVYIQRRRSDGSWRTKATAVLTDGGDVDSVYSQELRISRDGVYRVLVRTHDDHLGNRSRRVRLDVP